MLRSIASTVFILMIQLPINLGCTRQSASIESTTLEQSDGEISRVHVEVTAQQILVNGESVLTLRDESKDTIPTAELEGRLVLKLYSTVKEYRDAHRTFSHATDEYLDGNPFPFEDVVRLTVDDSLSFEILDRALYTLQGAGYARIECAIENRSAKTSTGFVVQYPEGFQVFSRGIHNEPYINLGVLLSAEKLTMLVSEYTGEGSAEFPRATFEQELMDCTSSNEHWDTCVDWTALNQVFHAHKQRYPSEQFYVLSVDDEVSIRFVATMIDAVRWYPIAPKINDEAAAEWTRWVDDRQKLFDRPLFAGGSR